MHGKIHAQVLYMRQALEIRTPKQTGHSQRHMTELWKMRRLVTFNGTNRHDLLEAEGHQLSLNFHQAYAPDETDGVVGGQGGGEGVQ